MHGARTLGLVGVVALAALAATACDQLNRPFGAASSSSSSGAPSPRDGVLEDASTSDGGAGADPDGGVPGLTPEPGDVRL